MQDRILVQEGAIESYGFISKTSILRIGIYLFASCIASLNILFCHDFLMATFVVIIELGILTYCLLKGNITKYIGCYLIFLCTSLEFSVFVGTEQFYGFKNFRILGVNLGFISLLPILALVCFKGIKINKIKTYYPRLYNFATFIFFLFSAGIVFGLFQILLNDNNIQNMDHYIFSFIGECYSMIALPFLMIVSFAYLLSWESNNVSSLEDYLISILIGIVVSLVISLGFEIMGHYGGMETLLASTVSIYIPFMFILPFCKSYKFTLNISIIMFATIGTMLMLKYNASGKFIIFCLITPLIICYTAFKNKATFLGLIFIVILSIIVIFGIPFILENNTLFRYKFDQAMALLRFWSDNWIQNMPGSPQFRIGEFINICYEYMSKPWFIFFGKGYMGSINDHVGIFGAHFVPDAFSIDQWANGTFYNMHEALNVLFLYHGILGLTFYAYILKNVIANFTRNPWILIGGVWVLIFYGYSFTISAFGLSALLFGFATLDNVT